MDSDLCDKTRTNSKPTAVGRVIQCLDDIERLHQEGYSLSEIAKQFSLRPTQFYSALRRARQYRAENPDLGQKKADKDNQARSVAPGADSSNTASERLTPQEMKKLFTKSRSFENFNIELNGK